MPELPEVEVLVRHLRPLLRGRSIRQVEVRRPKVVLPTAPRAFSKALKGARFAGVSRRGKYLLFRLNTKNGSDVVLLGHLGMTGRMFLTSERSPLPKHTAVLIKLDRGRFVFEDTRYFGRLTLNTSALDRLGPEPLSKEFRPGDFAQSLKHSRQCVKVKLLDQSLVAGVGNIYASEALFRARISPEIPAAKLSRRQAARLHKAIREVLADAIACGSTVPVTFGSGGKRDGFFYFGRSETVPDYYEERLLVYDRMGQPCRNCRRPIKRIVQCARSTFFCPHCQRYP